MSGRGHDLRVIDVVAETSDAVTLALEVPSELADRFGYSCGQFLTVRVPSAETGSVARCYSLSSSPDEGSALAITVKRTAGGYASNWLCDNIVVGQNLTVLEPAGNFGPRAAGGDLLLCAAGSGVTPILSIAKSALLSGSGTVTVFYANRDSDSVIFAAAFESLVARFPARLSVVHWLESERGLPTIDDVSDVLGEIEFDDAYLCGPGPFMAVMQSVLTARGSSGRVHVEEYRSLTDNPFEAHTPSEPPRPASSTGNPVLEVEIDGDRHTFDWPKNKTLLDVLLDHGIDAPYVCKESACGTCVCSVRKGRTRMLLNESLIDDEINMGLTLACQTLPETDEVYVAFDQ